jgi:hypothetical protein
MWERQDKSCPDHAVQGQFHLAKTNWQLEHEYASRKNMSRLHTALFKKPVVPVEISCRMPKNLPVLAWSNLRNPRHHCTRSVWGTVDIGYTRTYMKEDQTQSL